MKYMGHVNGTGYLKSTFRFKKKRKFPLSWYTPLVYIFAIYQLFRNLKSLKMCGFLNFLNLAHSLSKSGM